jgi:hypothetical protein
MHDCYQLGIIDYDIPCDIVSTVFCIQFWIGHYRMKKQQFEMSQQEIEQEIAAIVDQKGQAVVYAKMPIWIGVYRQAKDEEVLLDAFSLRRQQYVLYDSPESGVVCRYIETPVSTDKHEIKAMKYEEVVVRIKMRNEIDNVVKVSRVIVPMKGVILDHAHDDSWLSGSVEMVLDSAFGKEIVNVRLVHTKIRRSDKTSMVGREATLTFVMDL